MVDEQARRQTIEARRQTIAPAPAPAEAAAIVAAIERFARDTAAEAAQPDHRPRRGGWAQAAILESVQAELPLTEAEPWINT